jgi:hypothetical protein
MRRGCATTETLTRRLQEKCAGTGAIHPPDELLRFILNGRRIPQGEQKVTLRALDELCLVLLGPLRGGAKKDPPAFGTTLGGLRQGQLVWPSTSTTPPATGPAAAVTAPMPIPIAVSPAPLLLLVPASYPVFAHEAAPFANAEMPTNDGLSLRAHDHAFSSSAGRGGGGGGGSSSSDFAIGRGSHQAKHKIGQGENAPVQGRGAQPSQKSARKQPAGSGGRGLGLRPAHHNRPAHTFVAGLDPAEVG